MATEASAQPSVEVPVQEKASGPIKTPIPSPAPGCSPPPRAPLTADQQTKYDWLLNQVKGWKEVPAQKGKPGPLTDSERMWLTRECLLRYLRATKWHQKDAEKRLLETVAWRRDYGVDELTAEHISPENETGKQMVLGYDKQGRVCHYLNPGLQNTNPSPRQVQHLVYMVERVLDIMPAQQETLALLINFKSSKSRTNTAPGISTGREVLHILQTHYPERLGRALIINVPWVVWGFFKLITPFIDPLTREKLKFNEDMNQYVPTEQLWTEFHGKLEFEYDHSVYWPALTKLSQERREQRKKRWEAGGKQIGEHEDYLTGHDEVGVAGKVDTAATPAANAGHIGEKLDQLKIDDAAPAVAAVEQNADESSAKAEEPKADVAKEAVTDAPDVAKPVEGEGEQKSA